MLLDGKVSDDPVSLLKVRLARLGPGMDAHIQAFVDATSFGEAFDKVKTLEPKLNDEQLKQINDILTTSGNMELGKAKSLETKVPSDALAAYTFVSQRWAGMPLGEQASTRLTELESDETFAELQKAEKEWDKLAAAMAKLAEPAEGQTASFVDLAYNRKNGRHLKVIQKEAKGIIKDYPESDFARRAQEVAKRYQIPISKEDMKAIKSLEIIMKAQTRLKDLRGSKSKFSDEKWKKGQRAHAGRHRQDLA